MILYYVTELGEHIFYQVEDVAFGRDDFKFIRVGNGQHSTKRYDELKSGPCLYTANGERIWSGRPVGDNELTSGSRA